MSRYYPKPIKPEELYIGLPVCLFMTFRGSEREKHGNNIENWCIEGFIGEIKEDIVTVTIPEDVQENHNLSTSALFFYARKKFREVGKAEPDYRLFRNREEAFNYEYFRDLRRAYHANNREKDNERTKAWENSHREERKEYERKRRKEFSAEISAQQHKSYETNKDGKRQYYIDNKEKIDAFQMQYRIDNKERIKDNNRKYNASHKEEIRQNKREWRKENRSKINENAKMRYAMDIEASRQKKNAYRNANKDRINAWYRKRYAEHIDEERERSKKYYASHKVEEAERKKRHREKLKAEKQEKER